MDSAAKQHLCNLIHLPDLPPCPAVMSHEGWQCWVADTKTTSDPADAIRHHIFSLSLHDHLAKEKPGWPPKLLSALFDHMDWAANGDALKGYPLLFQLWATKHISGFCSVNRMMKLWGLAASNTCPSCECMERAQHVPVCPHPDHDMVWQEAINGLAVWFDLSHTNPEIRDCICLTLRLRSIDACFAPFASPTIMAAALDQDAIGWMNFIEGRISLEWHTAQPHFYASISSSRTSRWWAKELVQNLLAMVHKMWIARNDVAHAIDEKGCKIKDGLTMDADIDEQFMLGYEDLVHPNFHLIDIGQPAIDRRSAGEQ